MMNAVQVSLIALLISSPALAQVCTNSSGVISFPSGSSDFCQTEPDYYAITIYEAGLCTAAPTAPTASSNIDTSSCTTVFTNSSGSTVSVENGSSTALSGTFTRPADGTYTHGYLLMSKDFIVKAAVDFGSGANYTGTDDTSTSGRYCMTSQGNRNGGANSAFCDSSVSAAGELTDPLVNLSDNPSASFVSSASVTIGSDTMNAYLVDSSDNLVPNTTAGISSAEGNVDGVVAIQAFGSAVTVTTSTTALDIAFRVSQGLSVNANYGPNGYMDLGNGPFYVVLSLN